MKRLATGYGLAEAPCYDDSVGLYFSDVAGGGVYCLRVDGVTTCIVPKRRGVGGIALHTDGGIVVTGRSVCHVRKGVTRELLAVDGIIFNDLCCDAAGRIWVGGVSRDLAVGSGAIYVVDGSGVPIRACGELGIPNGMAFTSDGSGLYIADSATRLVERLTIEGGTRITGRSVFVDMSQDEGPDFGYPPALPTPDGLALDQDGGVWVAVPGDGCIQRFAADGSVDFRIDVPGTNPTSLAFGGVDQRDVYITTTGGKVPPGPHGGVFHTRSDWAGLPVPFARV